MHDSHARKKQWLTRLCVVVVIALGCITGPSRSIAADLTDAVTKEQALDIATDIAWANFGLDEKKDAVAKGTIACTEKNADTRGLDRCLAQAYSAYDRVLNIVYKHVLETINDNGVRTAIQESQRKWIVYRDAERNAILAYDRTGLGTVGGSIVGCHAIQHIRERISELMTYTHMHEG